MSIDTERTLVAVFDSGHVEFLEYKPAHGKLEPILGDVASGLHHDNRDIVSDRPGRGSSGGGQHHAYEAEHDPKKLEKHNFVRAIAQALETVLDQHQFGRLVLVAPARSIGEFRSVASDKVKHVLWREVPKEMANLTNAQIHDHLVPLLQQPAK
jgi:protein required for attachment to host cells